MHMQITRGKIQRAQKVVVYGPEGIGKTTFAARFPDPLFIDTEGGTHHMDVLRLPKPSSWTMLLEQARYVRDTAGICETLVIDTADWAEQLCITEICAKNQKKGIEDFGYGKGYVYLAEEWGRMLNTLEEVIERGINVLVTAHAKMRKFEQPDEMGAYDRWELKLQKTTAPMLKEWADMVLFATYKTYIINVDNQGVQKGKNKAQGGQRVMHTSHHPCWDAKNRHGLPDEIPFDYQAIAPCIPTAGDVTTAPARETPMSAKAEAVPPIQPPDPIPQHSPTEEQIVSAPVVPLPSTQQLSPDIPKALADLMRTSFISELDIQSVVAEKGYYPIDTPIEKYDPGFVQGVLVGAWDQVVQQIYASKSEDTPF